MAALANDPAIALVAQEEEYQYETKQSHADRQQQISQDALIAARLSSGFTYGKTTQLATQEAALAKLNTEYQALCQLSIGAESVGLEESNVHLFSQAGPISAAYAYAQALDLEYNLCPATMQIGPVMQDILHITDEICKELAAGAQKADIENRPPSTETVMVRGAPVTRKIAGSAEVAAGLRSDIEVLRTNLAIVDESVRNTSGIDAETKISLHDILSKVWGLARQPVLVHYKQPEVVVRNLSLNKETGGGCIPGIITRLMVPYIFSIRVLFQHMQEGIIAIPQARSTAPLLPQLAPVPPAPAAPPPPITPAYAAQQTASTAAAPPDKNALIRQAVEIRREFLKLKEQLGHSLAKPIEEILSNHQKTLQQESTTIARLQLYISNDATSVNTMRGQVAARQARAAAQP